MFSKHKYHLQWLPAFLLKWIDGMHTNVQHMRGRRESRELDQQFKAAWRERRPDLKKMIRHYPFRYPLTPAIRRLYRQTAKEAGRTLGVWHNPWVVVPRCFFGLSEEMLAGYSTYRHEILLSEAYEYWFVQLEVFLLPLRAAMRLSQRGKHQEVAWVSLSTRLLQRAARQRKVFEGLVEDTGFFIELDEVWQQFIEELPPLMEACAQSNVLPLDFVLWCESLAEFSEELQHFLCSTFTHELIHAWTRWIEYRDGRFHYRLLGLEDRQRSAGVSEAEVKGALEHTAMNEALTEWIARRLCTQLYGRPSFEFKWRGVAFVSRYPAWIFEWVVRALDYHWSYLMLVVPSLAQWQVTQAADLLYMLCFTDAQIIGCFKEVLVALNGDNAAFEKLSRACERFTLRPPCEEALLEESLNDLACLLEPFTVNTVIPGEPPLDEEACIVKEEHNETIK